jgi:AraC-like DNA-binding protein
MQTAEPLPITDIAYLLGFSSASHFTKTFKQYTGQMPSAFRKR